MFVWQKDKSALGKLCPTERAFRKIENNPHNILPHVKSEVRRLSDRYQFFHWHLAFPDVLRLPEVGQKAENEQTGWNNGFDVVLGNPPWEQMEVTEKEWFSERNPEVAASQNSSERKQEIEKLRQSDPEVFRQFVFALREAAAARHFVRESGRFTLILLSNWSVVM